MWSNFVINSFVVLCLLYYTSCLFKKISKKQHIFLCFILFITKVRWKVEAGKWRPDTASVMLLSDSLRD